jgi:ketosteroid isomerase-like protein
MDALRECYGPGVIMRGLEDGPEPGPFGRAKFRSFITDVLNAWTQFHLETVEVFAVGDDRVVWRGDWHGTGAASGLNTSTSLTTLSTVRDGQVARIDYYFDHDQALKAMGLEE